MNPGIVVYCIKHDQGAILLDKHFSDLNFENINHSICGVDNCIWEQHGIALYNQKNISYMCYHDNTYEDLCGGWKTDYFASNIYDKNLNLLNDDLNIEKHVVKIKYY